MKKCFSVRTSPALGAREFAREGIVERRPLLDEKGHKSVLNVDQFSGLPFMLNSSGFVMNDIMMYEQAQSDSVARSVLARIKEIKPQLLGDEEFSMTEAFERVCPPHFGSPAEFLAYQEKIAELDYNRVQALKVKREEESKKISFAEQVDQQTNS